MTVELAEYLLGLDKYVVQDGITMDNFSLDIQYPMRFRLTLSTPDDLDQNLLVDVKESDKKTLKVNLYHQDNSTQNGLLRIDYNSRHQNPMEVIDTVPDKFIPFAGQWLDNYAGHIHYVVDGYKPLAWAIPLEIDLFPVIQLNERVDYIDTLQAFFQKINTKTIFTFTHQLRAI